MIVLPPALHEMGAYNQFILYKLVPSRKDPAKMDKLPVDFRTLQVFVKGDDWQNRPECWTNAEHALETAALCGPSFGVGFFFTRHDPFFFLDIDKAYDGTSWSPLALELVAAMQGCAVEISQSGTGLHIFGQATPGEHACKNVALGIELYTEGRFVALTGTQATGDSGYHADAAYAQLVAQYFQHSGVERDGAGLSTEPVAEWNGPSDDGELIARAMRSTSVGATFGKGATFADLYQADADALGRAYPGDSGSGFDHSSADAALCQHLAFWTGNHGERMDKLFRESALMRDKWDDREDYRLATIGHAVALCKTAYKQSAPDRSPDAAPVEKGGRDGLQYLPITQQIEHFAGCVYVRDVHRVLVPDGSLLNPERFRVEKGGYLFSMDSTGHKETKNAWEAFTESQAYDFPKVHSCCFRPEVAAGKIVEEEGRLLVNTYTKIETPRIRGDAGPFLRHIEALLPIERDRSILMAYIAALVQYPGVKFQWAPLLQGIEGNGKTLISTCLSYAIGQRYTHLPNSSDLVASGGKFNAWLQGRLFIGLEEIYVSDKRDFIEVLKPLITNSRMEIQGKGLDQVMGDNRANFLLCSNHKDAIRKTQNDRRYCVFYTAQQKPEDLVRLGWLKPDGSTTRYFPDLWSWLRADGYAIINDYLRSYVIPEELNPATLCQRAPSTSSTAEALSLSLGRIEQEVVEAIGEDRLGFCGGWISSTAFDKMLEDRRDEKRVPPNKRRELLQSLGFDYHPALKDGRSNSPSPIDGGKKPRIYIQIGHIHSNLTQPSEVLRCYTEAQNGAPPTDADRFARASPP